MSFLGYHRRVHKEFYAISCLSSISLCILYGALICIIIFQLLFSSLSFKLFSQHKLHSFNTNSIIMAPWLAVVGRYTG